MEKTTLSAKAADVQRNWYIIDASDKILGRLASFAASRLRGKHKTCYTPHVDTGDYIVIVNAENVRVTGNKEEGKKYYHHTGYPGGIKETNVAKVRAEHPERLLENAIRGMLPKGPLGRDMFRKLKIYTGAEHPHAGQNPTVVEDINK
jgi:large subunit ribosomal protein L13